MEGMGCILTFLMIFQAFNPSKSQQECDNAIPTKSSLLFLSTEKMTPNEAKTTCASREGHLWEPKYLEEVKDVKDKLRLQADLFKSLLKVEVLQHRNNSFIRRFFSSSRHYNINRTEWIPMNPRTEFYVFRNETAGFDVQIEFCSAAKYDHIQSYCEDENNTLFQSYVGRHGNLGILLNYALLYDPNTDQISSTLGLNGSQLNPKNLILIDSFQFVIPDFSVYLGLISRRGQEYWFTYDGTLVSNDYGYPLSNESLCEVLTMPMTFSGEKVNGIKQPCDSERKAAFMLCDHKIAINSDQVNCSEDSLRLYWNSSSLPSLQNVTLRTDGLDSSTRTQPIDFYSNNEMILPLQHNVWYTIIVLVEGTGCVSFNITKVIRTFLLEQIPVPNPVGQAVAYNEYGGDEGAMCIVEWMHNAFESHISHYEISAVGHNIVQNLMHADRMSILSSNFLSGKVEYLMTDFGNLPDEAEIGFEIRAVSCQGKSVPLEVYGKCRPRKIEIDLYSIVSRLLFFVIAVAMLVTVPVGVKMLAAKGQGGGTSRRVLLSTPGKQAVEGPFRKLNLKETARVQKKSSISSFSSVLQTRSVSSSKSTDPLLVPNFKKPLNKHSGPSRKPDKKLTQPSSSQHSNKGYGKSAKNESRQISQPKGSRSWVTQSRKSPVKASRSSPVQARKEDAKQFHKPKSPKHLHLQVDKISVDSVSLIDIEVSLAPVYTTSEMEISRSSEKAPENDLPQVLNSSCITARPPANVGGKSAFSPQTQSAFSPRTKSAFSPQPDSTFPSPPDDVYASGSSTRLIDDSVQPNQEPDFSPKMDSTCFPQLEDPSSVGSSTRLILDNVRPNQESSKPKDSSSCSSQKSIKHSSTAHHQGQSMRNKSRYSTNSKTARSRTNFKTGRPHTNFKSSRSHTHFKRSRSHTNFKRSKSHTQVKSATSGEISQPRPHETTSESAPISLPLPRPRPREITSENARINLPLPRPRPHEPTSESAPISLPLPGPGILKNK